MAMLAEMRLRRMERREAQTFIFVHKPLPLTAKPLFPIDKQEDPFALIARSFPYQHKPYPKMAYSAYSFFICGLPY